MSSDAPSVASPSTLVSRLWPASGQARLAALRSALLIVAGTTLLTVSAKIQVPFYPVPLTLQSLVVLILGAAYGWRLGGATVALYLAEGALGLPVFANTPPVLPGLAYLAGPTGGFLAGFVAAAMLTGFMAERGWDRSPLRILLMMTLGHAVLFAFGLGWLAALVGGGQAWAVGAEPFLAATVLKTGLAAALFQAASGYARPGGSKA